MGTNAYFYLIVNNDIKYSIIIPVYNRPQEVDELLESLTHQQYKHFEVLLVEDGSRYGCKEVFEKYADRLSIRYFFKANTGPGPSRNFGYQQAKGEYFVVFDSDCIIPPHYFAAVELFRQTTRFDAWGGADRGHKNFTPLQRAMAFTMSSFLTTGGIRGGKKQVASFQPRSFNMGISRAVFLQTGGFRFSRYAEDIEFSIRIRKSNFVIAYIPDAFVFHKRRSTLREFYQQVYNFGRGRVQVGNVHKGAIKFTHAIPLLWVIGFFLSVFFLLFSPGLGKLLIVCYPAYFITIAISAYQSTSSLQIAILSIPTAIVQLTGYGVGFLREFIPIKRQGRHI